MQKSVLSYIACPNCSAGFELTVDQQDDAEIVTGKLRCTQCSHTYPITGGIPRLLPDALRQDKSDTASAFGWEWQEFSMLHGDAEYKNQFFDWVKPIEPEFLQDKVVLDAGCGMGRFAAVASRSGAKEVLAIDLSGAVEAAYANTRTLDNVHVIQADIYNLPLLRGSDAKVDFAYSIGVLHHLPDPEGGFRAITQHVKPGGSVFGWVYGRENNGWIVRLVDPARKHIFSRLPRRVLYWLSFLISVFLHPLIKLLYRPFGRDPARAERTRLPYAAYLGWLAQFGFRHTHHVVFDHLVAPTAFYIRGDEYAAWFRRAEMENITTSWRNRNSWRGHGVITEATHRVTAKQ